MRHRRGRLPRSRTQRKLLCEPGSWALRQEDCLQESLSLHRGRHLLFFRRPTLIDQGGATWGGRRSATILPLTLQTLLRMRKETLRPRLVDVVGVEHRDRQHGGKHAAQTEDRPPCQGERYQDEHDGGCEPLDRDRHAGSRLHVETIEPFSEGAASLR